MDFIQLSKPSITDEEVQAAERTLRSGWLVSGPEGRAFEEELAQACGRRHAAVVSSGTAALHLALLALRPGARRLLVPAFTFPATANVAGYLGPGAPLAVELADVDERTFCVPEAAVAAWIGRGEGPVMVVHQFGYPAPIPTGDAVISDAACAIGVRAATAGRCACLSFHPRKLLTTGEGGAVVSDDEGLIRSIRELRAHGLVAKEGLEVMDEVAPGLNYRMPEMAAAIGRVQLRRLPGIIAAHRERAMRYRERLLGALPMQDDHPGRVWQTVAVVLPDHADRAKVRRALREGGPGPAPGTSIETQIASYGLHRLSAFRDAAPDAFPVADRLHRQALALPLHAELSLSQVDHVCDRLLQELHR